MCTFLFAGDLLEAYSTVAVRRDGLYSRHPGADATRDVGNYDARHPRWGRGPGQEKSSGSQELTKNLLYFFIMFSCSRLMESWRLELYLFSSSKMRISNNEFKFNFKLIMVFLNLLWILKSRYSRYFVMFSQWFFKSIGQDCNMNVNSVSKRVVLDCSLK